jgi:hypothetical protein
MPSTPRSSTSAVRPGTASAPTVVKAIAAGITSSARPTPSVSSSRGAISSCTSSAAPLSQALKVPKKRLSRSGAIVRATSALNR